MLLCFFAGSIVGSFTGSFFSYDSAIGDFNFLTALSGQSFINILIQFTKFHIVVIILATSFLGIVLMPLLSCLRGYALSCTAASIIATNPKNGLPLAFIILGIPAIFSVPCFFALSVEGYFSSKRMLAYAKGIPSKRTNSFIKQLIVCLPALAAGTLVEMKLVPFLVSLLR